MVCFCFRGCCLGVNGFCVFWGLCSDFRELVCENVESLVLCGVLGFLSRD